MTGSPPVVAPGTGVTEATVVLVGSAGVVTGTVVVGSVLVGSVPVGSEDVTGEVVGSVAVGVVLVVVVVGSDVDGVVAVTLVEAAGTPLLDARVVTPGELWLAAEPPVAAVVVAFAGSAVLVAAFGTRIRDASAAPAAVPALVEDGSATGAVASVGLGVNRTAGAAPVLGTAARAIV